MSDSHASGARVRDSRGFRILFVCTGNVCRSPYAEIFTRHLLVGRLGGSRAAAFRVTSAGTHAVRGSPMDSQARRELAPWRLDTTAADPFVARQLDRLQIAKADLVLAATRRHRSEVMYMVPEARNKVFTIREFARVLDVLDLADFSADPVQRAYQLVDAVQTVKGAARPAKRIDDDLPDPVRQTQEVHHKTAVLIQQAVQVLVDAIARPLPAGGAGGPVPARAVNGSGAGVDTGPWTGRQLLARIGIGRRLQTGEQPAIAVPSRNAAIPVGEQGPHEPTPQRLGGAPVAFAGNPPIPPARTLPEQAAAPTAASAPPAGPPVASTVAPPAARPPPAPPPAVPPAAPEPAPPDDHAPAVPAAAAPAASPATSPAASPAQPQDEPPRPRPAPTARPGPGSTSGPGELPRGGGTQPHELTALEQAAAIRRRELTPAELVEHALKRVAELDPVLGAFVTVASDAAWLQAIKAAGRLGEPAAPPALLGVPTAIKDLAMTAGVRTTFGSAVYADHVPDRDDDSARLLREAGAVSLGKTSTPEFGLPPYTEPAGRPPAVTPWDTGRSAGGSSGGAAAAVAAGLVSIAHGTDGGGSIRIPAAVCGLVGLKTSRGLVSRGPMGGDPIGLSVAGPLARTVTDAAAMLDALAVPVRSEPVRPAPRPAAGSYLAHARRATPERLRIGRYADPPLPGVEVDPECIAGYERAAELLAELGHEVVDAEHGVDPEFLPVFETLWSVLAHSHPVKPEDEDKLTPLTRWWRDRGAEVSGPAFLSATQRAAVVARAVLAAHAPFDVMLTPTLAQLPRPVGWFTEPGEPAEDYERQKRFTPFTALYNITGQPALTLPLHWTADPVLPVGVQLVGMPGADALLLELGGQLEAAAPWAHRRPPTG